MLSILVHYNPDIPVTGLDKFKPEDRPPVMIPFQAYHLMVALGMFFIASSLLGLFLLWRGVLFQQKWLMWVYVFAVLGAYAANQSGWVAAEVGRQPWVVYGLLRTKDAISPSVPATHMLASMIMFGVVYSFLFVVWVHVMNDKIQHGPQTVAETAAEPPVQDDAKDVIALVLNFLKRGPSSLSETWRNPPKGEPDPILTDSKGGE
jgi:cytochrome d ubiquinol oxidase subunit I